MQCWYQELHIPFIQIQKVFNILFHLLYLKYSLHILYIYHYILGWAFYNHMSSYLQQQRKFFLFLLFIITEDMWLSYVKTRPKNVLETPYSRYATICSVYPAHYLHIKPPRAIPGVVSPLESEGKH